MPRSGQKKIICSVYSFHPTLYLGYPGLIPKIKSDAAKKAVEAIPIIGKSVDDVMLLHDSDFILRCHFGDFWPVMALCSGVYEPFTEGGRFLRQHRHIFFTKDTVQEWVSDIPRLRKQATVDVAIRILTAEKIVGGGTSFILSSLDMDSIDSMVGNPGIIRRRAEKVMDAIDNPPAGKNLQPRMTDKELNALLISTRLFL